MAQLKTPATKSIHRRIYFLRGQRVVMDSDLAQIYGTTTKVLNQAVKRNRDRFPADFIFKILKGELDSLRSHLPTGYSAREGDRSQFVTGSQKHRDPRFLPYAFTEHGAVMAANILRSKRAIAMSVYVVRAFIKLREVLAGTKEFTKKLAALERKLTSRLDIHEEAILRLFTEIRELLNPPPPAPEPLKRRIGFRVD